MTKTEIKEKIAELKIEVKKYKFPQKKFMSIHGKVAALSKMLKPNYKEKQSLAGKKGSKKRWVK
jgi:hypothetical protein